MRAATTEENIVSVIIPAYNEELTIRRCLSSIVKQDYRNIEVIVVDDFSSDKTSSFVEQFAQKFKLNLKLTRNSRHKERSKSRNLGAKLSRGKHLLFIDSDMQLDKKVISECIKIANSDQAIKAIIIPEKSYGEGFWAKCRVLEKECYIGDDRVEAARFFKKEAFWKVGGWDNKMISGEDWDLTKRLREKYKLVRVNARIFHYEGRLTLWKIIRKKFYYAFRSGVYLEKYPLKIEDLFFFIFRPAYLRNWRLIISDPIHGVGMFLLKTMELFAGGAGYLFSKIPNPLSVYF